MLYDLEVSSVIGLDPYKTQNSPGGSVPLGINPTIGLGRVNSK